MVGLRCFGERVYFFVFEKQKTRLLFTGGFSCSSSLATVFGSSSPQRASFRFRNLPSLSAVEHAYLFFRVKAETAYDVLGQVFSHRRRNLQVVDYPTCRDSFGVYARARFSRFSSPLSNQLFCKLVKYSKPFDLCCVINISAFDRTKRLVTFPCVFQVSLTIFLTTSRGTQFPH